MGRRPSWLDGRRRRTILGLVGLLHIGMGLQLISRPMGDPDLARAVLYEVLLPMPVRIGLWLAAGIACVILSIPRRAEPIGWMVVIVMPIERALGFGWSALMWLIPGWPPGAVTSVGAALIWAAIAVVLMIISGWTEQEPVP